MAGFHNYFMYYNNGHKPDILDNEINESKRILERIIRQWELIIKT